MPKKRICLLLDGTWSQDEARTPIDRLQSTLATRDHDDVHQQVYYDRDPLPARARAIPGQTTGLSRGALRAYRFLCEHYEDGDEIYFFGASRGALTARTVIGMMVRCGLVYREAPLTPEAIFTRYRQADRRPSLQRLRRSAKSRTVRIAAADRELLDSSRRVPIKFVGVWDTVSAFGVRAGEIRRVGRRSMGFRYTRPSSIVEHGYQALAIDEAHPLYRPVLWPEYRYQGALGRAISRNYFEQRWFVGSHANLIGDSEQDPLAHRPFTWIERRAWDTGLAFNDDIADPRRASLDGGITAPRGRAAAALARLGGRERKIGRRPVVVCGGSALPLNETIDVGALERWEADTRYRPPALERWRIDLGIESFLGVRRSVYAETGHAVDRLLPARCRTA